MRVLVSKKKKDYNVGDVVEVSALVTALFGRKKSNVQVETDWIM